MKDASKKGDLITKVISDNETTLNYIYAFIDNLPLDCEMNKTVTLELLVRARAIENDQEYFLREQERIDQ